jgi:two-component system response regulator AtoC
MGRMGPDNGQGKYPEKTYSWSACGTVERPGAMKLSAYDYIFKPFKQDEVLLTLGRRKRGAAQGGTGTQGQDQRDREILFVTSYPGEAMAGIRPGSHGVGPQDHRAHHRGERNRQELVAGPIHSSNPRAPGPLVAINQQHPRDAPRSELSVTRRAFTDAVRDKPGRFEEADRGTYSWMRSANPLSQVKPEVFQDEEIAPWEGELKKIDVQVITATARDLKKDVEAGRFREDLYRINVLTIHLPPLRERRGTSRFSSGISSMFNKKLKKNVEGLSPGSAHPDGLSRPGNVGELENVTERAVLLPRVNGSPRGPPGPNVSGEGMSSPFVFKKTSRSLERI